MESIDSETEKEEEMDDDCRGYYNRVHDCGNDAIVENEKIIDRQGIVVSVGLLTIIFTMFHEIEVADILKNVIVGISCLILILSFLMPAHFIRQNRRMLGELEKERENLGSKEDVVAVRNRYIKDGMHGWEKRYELGMNLWEAVRVFLLFVNVILIFIFFISQ